MPSKQSSVNMELFYMVRNVLWDSEIKLFVLQDPENRIEQIKASDATLTYDELIYSLNMSPNNLGDKTWKEVAKYGGTELTGTEINKAIDYYREALTDTTLFNYYNMHYYAWFIMCMSMWYSLL